MPGLAGHGRRCRRAQFAMRCEFSLEVLERRCARAAFKQEIQVEPGRGRGGLESRRWRDGTCFGQLPQPLADRVGGNPVGLALPLMRGEQVLEHVPGIEEGVDHGVAQMQFALAHAVEQVFEDVGDVLQVGEAEGAARALDRMRGAEDRVELLGVRVGDVQAQQQVFHAGQMLGGLLEKDLMELAHVDGHGASLRKPGAAAFSRSPS